MPLWTPFTESMFRIDVFLLMLTITIPRSLLLERSCPLKYQEMFKGWSPLLIAQDMDAMSPAFAGSSPNSKGNICGGTVTTRIAER